MILGYRIGQYEIHPEVSDGPVLLKITQASCPVAVIDGLDQIYSTGDTVKLSIYCVDERGQRVMKQPGTSQVRVHVQKQADSSNNITTIHSRLPSIVTRDGNGGL